MGESELLAGRDGSGINRRRWNAYCAVHGKALGEKEGRRDRVAGYGPGWRISGRGRVDGDDCRAKDLDEPAGKF